MKPKIKILFNKILNQSGFVELFKAIAIAYTYYPIARTEDIVEAYKDVFEEYEAMTQEAVEGRR